MQVRSPRSATRRHEGKPFSVNFHLSQSVSMETGKAGGFALMEMAEAKDEDSAISVLDGAEWLGRQSRVKNFNPRLATRRLAL